MSLASSAAADFFPDSLLASCGALTPSGCVHAANPSPLLAIRPKPEPQLPAPARPGGNLLDRDTFSKSDPICVLYVQGVGNKEWRETFSSCGEQGLLFVVVHGLLIVVASLVVEHGL
ncbi:hypothetical protein J1605_022308 [Eschrichtius robustus]|uniref:Uncharacterized protein n=1 Tax=Eschrichtius robustus TaxID=9764 RepID=A0AB34HCJ5_ESCRO|nr:hypothetical protein J1605_022308 [Eschrichtius robustus]